MAVLGLKQILSPLCLELWLLNFGWTVHCIGLYLNCRALSVGQVGCHWQKAAADWTCDWIRDRRSLWSSDRQTDIWWFTENLSRRECKRKMPFSTAPSTSTWSAVSPCRVNHAWEKEHERVYSRAVDYLSGHFWKKTCCDFFSCSFGNFVHQELCAFEVHRVREKTDSLTASTSETEQNKTHSMGK